MTNKLDQFAAREKGRTAPPQLSTDLEREVMTRVKASHPTRRRLARRSIFALAAVFAVLVGTVIGIRVFRSAPPQMLGFNETVIILDDHVAIWLEPDEIKGKT